MSLAQEIKQYYFENLGGLSEDKRFHLASRIAAWEGDPQAYELLIKLRHYLLPEGVSLEKLFSDVITKPKVGRRIAHNLRQPYFEKYPKLTGLHSALFRARHLKAVLGIDAKDALFGVVPEAQFKKLYNQLLVDPGAMRVLSSVGVNYMYIYKSLIGQRDLIDPALFVDIARGYKLYDPTNIRLQIYLYTHSIIGETNFYTEAVSTRHRPLFAKMLNELEEIIAKRFDDVSLDNKLEFLVCCRICGINSPLFKKIYNECQKSISPEGHFLIDRHNKNSKSLRSSFSSSEHRNVLFIMSSSLFNPHLTLVS
ncbi:MAG: hypothetical protein WDZ34_00355 [Candidatus Saccharimonadales bacterium]